MNRTAFWILTTLLIVNFSHTTAICANKQGKATKASAKSAVNPYGMLFEGDGIRVEMATYTATNADGLHDVIIKISGHEATEAGIEGKAIKYTATPAGTGADFTFIKDGKSQTRMLTRQPWESWTTFEVLLNGKTLKVSKNEKKSKQVRPLRLLTELAK